jgi:hypothetical protein
MRITVPYTRVFPKEALSPEEENKKRERLTKEQSEEKAGQAAYRSPAAGSSNNAHINKVPGNRTLELGFSFCKTHGLPSPSVPQSRPAWSLSQKE